MGGLRIRLGAAPPSPLSLDIARANALRALGRDLTLTLPSLPFVDTFGATNDPMPNGSVYVQGLSPGVDWQNLQTTPGRAFASAASAGFNDCIAVAKNLPGISTSKHYAEITKHQQVGYTPASSHEVEGLVYFDITAHSARGYEADDIGSGVQPVRWNGDLSDFQVFSDGWGNIISGSFPTLSDGQKLRVFAQIVSGNVRLTYTIDGVTAVVFEDQSAGKITSGWPGFGCFVRPAVNSSDWAKLCVSRFEAGNW